MFKLKTIKTHLNVGLCKAGDTVEYKTVKQVFNGYEIESFKHVCKETKVYSVPTSTMHATVNGKVKVNLTIEDVING